MFQGNNASVWRDALYAVNGFEGEMGYGGLDKALGYRLRNLGVRGLQARHRAVCLHLHHELPYKDPGDAAAQPRAPGRAPPRRRRPARAAGWPSWPRTPPCA